MDYLLNTPLTSDMISTNALLLSDNQISDFNFTESDDFVAGTYLLLDADTIDGNLGDDTSEMIEGRQATLQMQGNDLILVVAPEPNTLTLLAVGGIAYFGYRLRRRRKTALASVPTTTCEDDAPAILSFPSQRSRRIEAKRRAA
jgi:hypothetical protein